MWWITRERAYPAILSAPCVWGSADEGWRAEEGDVLKCKCNSVCDSGLGLRSVFNSLRANLLYIKSHTVSGRTNRTILVWSSRISLLGREKVKMEPCIPQSEEKTVADKNVRDFCSGIQRWNSWKYNFVEVSGKNLEIFQIWGFYLRFCLPRKCYSLIDFFV